LLLFAYLLLLLLFVEEMLDCCKNKSVKLLEEYHEDERACYPKNGGRGWWSYLFIIDYVSMFLLSLISGIIYTCTEPHDMYIPTVDITTAIVDSSGVPHNVVQTINIAEDVQYPYKAETVPAITASLILVCSVAFCWGFSQVVFRRLATRKWQIVHDLHNFLIGAYESRTLQYFYVAVLKPFAGRNRPRYLELAEKASSDPDKLDGISRSYPSDLSAAAFSTLFFCALYILGKSRIYSRNNRFGGGAAGRFCVLIFVSVIILAAFLIAVSRTRDYVDNFSDINAGAMIGIICAVLSYFHMYPPLTDSMCQLPRIRLAENSAFQSKIKEEDDGASLTEVLVSKDYSNPESSEMDEKVAEVKETSDQTESTEDNLKNV